MSSSSESQSQSVSAPGPLSRWQVSMLTIPVSAAQAQSTSSTTSATSSPSATPSMGSTDDGGENVCYDSLGQRVGCEGGSWPSPARIIAVVVLGVAVIWFIYALYRLRRRAIARRNAKSMTDSPAGSAPGSGSLPLPVAYTVNHRANRSHRRPGIKNMFKSESRIQSQSQSPSPLRHGIGNASEVTLVSTPDPVYLVPVDKSKEMYV